MITIQYVANLEGESFLFDQERWVVDEGDVIVTENGLEEISKIIPTGNLENKLFITKSKKTYFESQILNYGKRVPYRVR